MLTVLVVPGETEPVGETNQSRASLDVLRNSCRSKYNFHLDVAQLGRAPGLGPGGCRFNSCHPDQFQNGVAGVPVSILACEACGTGSTPVRHPNFVPEW